MWGIIPLAIWGLHRPAVVQPDVVSHVGVQVQQRRVDGEQGQRLRKRQLETQVGSVDDGGDESGCGQGSEIAGERCKNAHQS